METEAATLENGVNISSSIASLSGVVEAGLYLKFLHHVGTGQRSVGEFGYVVVGSTDALNQVVVVVLALAVYFDANVSTAQGGGGIQRAVGSRGQSQQLLKVLRRQRQAANRVRLD